MSRQYFLSYTAGYETNFEEFVMFAHREGFSGVELIPDLSPNLLEQISTDRVKQLVQIAKDTGIRYTIHNVYMDINPTSLVPAVRDLALQVTRHAAFLAFSLGAIGLVIHTGYRSGAWRNKPTQAKMYEEQEIQCYQEIAACASNYGVPLFIENGSYYLSSRHGTRTPLHTGIDSVDLLRIVESVGSKTCHICFDVGKAYLSAETVTVQAVLDYLDLIKMHVAEIHINTFPDYEDVIPPILDKLDSLNFSGPIVFECSSTNISSLKKLVNFGIKP